MTWQLAAGGLPCLLWPPPSCLWLDKARCPAACCRDEHYYLTFTSPGSASGQQQQNSSSSGSSGLGGRWRGLLPPPPPWQAAKHAGSVRVCLRCVTAAAAFPQWLAQIVCSFDLLPASRHR